MKVKLENVLVKERVGDWKEAIEVAASPLLANGYINEAYVNQMISNCETMGPYIVISNDVAIPHARREDGVIKSGYSVLKLKERVCFDETDNSKCVNTIMALAFGEPEEHLNMLQYIAKVMSNKEVYEGLISSEKPEDIVTILNSGYEEGGE